jgi:hypothetical protein
MVCSSIPSRNDQVIVQNESKVGFNRSISGLSHRKLAASQSRIIIKDLELLQKTNDLGQSNTERKTAISNAFVSKTQRNDYIRLHPNSGPGPGYYSDVQNGFTDKILKNYKPNQDFKRQRKEVQKPT